MAKKILSRGGQGRSGVSSTVAARLSCGYNFRMLIDAGKKSRRGRPRVDTEEVGTRFPRDTLIGLDAYVAALPEPRPSRPEAIRFLLRDSLTGLGYLPAVSEGP